MKADDGETLHGFRSGCAITLALTGADLSEMMEYVGWKLHCDGASGRLAMPSVGMVVAPWQDANLLKRFVCAFPSSEQRNNRRSDCNVRKPKAMYFIQRDVLLLCV